MEALAPVPADNILASHFSQILMPSHNQTSGTGVSPVQAQAEACGYK
jgi:hypothetical protein